VKREGHLTKCPSKSRCLGNGRTVLHPSLAPFSPSKSNHGASGMGEPLNSAFQLWEVLLLTDELGATRRHRAFQPC
jgi:hypothetical protein